MPRMSKLVSKSLLTCSWEHSERSCSVTRHVHVVVVKKKRSRRTNRPTGARGSEGETLWLNRGQGFKGQPAEVQAPRMSVFFCFEMS